MMFKSGDMDYTQKMKRCHEYVEALEEEQKKIQVFQRELPLCLELVTQGNVITHPLLIYIFFVFTIASSFLIVYISFL